MDAQLLKEKVAIITGAAMVWGGRWQKYLRKKGPPWF